MRDIVTPISRRQAAEHARISEALDELLRDICVLRDEAAVADGMLLVLARRIMADTARLVSREPGARAMKRLPAGPGLPAAVVRDTLNDARLALRTFERAHGWRDDPMGEVSWLTHEEMREWGEIENPHPATP